MFVKEGAKSVVLNKIRASLLQSAQAWELLVDLKRSSLEDMAIPNRGGLQRLPSPTYLEVLDSGPDGD